MSSVYQRKQNAHSQTLEIRIKLGARFPCKTVTGDFVASTFQEQIGADSAHLRTGRKGGLSETALACGWEMLHLHHGSLHHPSGHRQPPFRGGPGVFNTNATSQTSLE